ncbi:MAG TPA: SDR family oxidoreductase [Terriglobales bacterium]|nr:SDR family oxidoreductase [Terriglobales bacterium]
MAAIFKKLEGKTAIITGAAKGIGQAIARRFKAEGCKVFLADIAGDELAAMARELKCGSCKTDVSRRTDIDRMIAQAIEELGNVDILVNNAGVPHTASLTELDEADFDRVMSINLKSALLASQQIAKHMMPRGSGAIVNMSSVNALLANPTQIPYAVSKGGLNQLTRVLAVALAPHNIRVNAIGPGTILTDLARAILVDDALREKVMSRTPLGRCGDPDEVATIASFLASDDSSYITGQTIYADGGRLALNYTM